MQTKFKSRGKKAGAIAGWKLLKESGLASLVEFKAQRGTDKVILQLYVCTHVQKGNVVITSLASDNMQDSVCV